MGIPPRKYYTIAYAIWYSTAVGYLHITDAEDVDAPPDFDPKIVNMYVSSKYLVERHFLIHVPQVKRISRL